MPRLFVALPLPTGASRALARIQPPETPGLKLVRQDQMHLTLHFIGEGRITPTRDALAQIQAKAFSLQIRGVGQFPPHSRAATLWAGIAPSDLLITLHQLIGNALGNIGFTPEKRPFAPHITLARCKAVAPQSVIKNFLEQHAAFLLPPMTVQTFTLFSSTSTPDGPHYRHEHDFTLMA